MAIMQEIETKLQKGISVSTDEEVYYALLELVKDKAEKKVSNKGKKKHKKRYKTIENKVIRKY